MLSLVAVSVSLWVCRVPRIETCAIPRFMDHKMRASRGMSELSLSS